LMSGKKNHNPKDLLLDWIKRRTQGYKNVNVTNFSTCWGDGLALCALVHCAHPDLIRDFDSLKPENCRENVSLALNSAEKFGIEKWLDTEDICAYPKTDVNSMVTYLSQFYNAYNGRNPNAGLGKINEADIIAYDLIEQQRKEREKRRKEEMETATIEKAQQEKDRERKEKEERERKEKEEREREREAVEKEGRERREKEERERKGKEKEERERREEEIRKENESNESKIKPTETKIQTKTQSELQQQFTQVVLLEIMFLILTFLFYWSGIISFRVFFALVVVIISSIYGYSYLKNKEKLS